MAGETVMGLIMIVIHLMGFSVFYFNRYCPNVNSDIGIYDFNQRRDDYMSYFIKMSIFLGLFTLISLGI